MTTSVIKYRINSVTSESPQYPASNLSDPSSSVGWQSDYSPSYPQEINLQFFTPIRTKTLKLTFHQYKIPTLVEVFVRLTAKQNYRKLGYIVPNDNSQSSYEHKEIKTLYFEFPCNFIKLVFYQNYKNEMNLFEQVALEDLKIEGQAMTYNEIKNIDLTEEQSSADQIQREVLQGNQSNQQRPKIPQYSSNLMQTAGMQELNKKFNEVYTYLQSQKLQAVEKQDFRLASHLKNVIQTFKASQSEIFSLQMQKRQALEEEDFDKCHRIKQQIQKQKEEFQYRMEQMYQNQDNFMSEFSHSRILQDPERMTQRKQTQIEDKGMEGIKNFVSSTPEREYATSVGKIQNAQQGKKLSLNLNAQNFGNISGFGANNISAVSQNQSLTINKVVDHNEEIIPVVRKKLLGIKQQPQNEFPQTTNRSVFEESKNYSSVSQRRGHQQQSPRGLQNRSKSPPKSPTRKVVTKAQSYVAVASSNMSLKSPIISYEQIQYKEVKQQTFNPQQKRIPTQQQMEKSQKMQELLDRLKRLEVEPLDLKLRLKLQSHFVIIQQPYWQMIMHKSWSLKKQALQHIRDDVTINNKQAYMAVMEFISFSINDPHPQVLLTTLSILRKLIQQGNSNNVEFTLPHMPYFIETIVNALLSMITFTNKQLSEQAYNLYLMLGMIGFLTIQYLVQKLIKHKHTTKVTPQYTVMKISLMISMIERYQQTVKYFKEILLWAVEFLKDPNNKVRSQASYVILILVDIIGEDKVLNIIKEKPQLMKIYQEILNNSQLIQSSRLDSLGEGSRYTDRNLSKLQDINFSSINNNKSLSKQRTALKNKSQVSQNPSSLSNQQQQQQKSSKRLKNPWTTNDEKSQKPRSNSRSRLDSQRNDDQLLQYSKESQFYGSSIKGQSKQVSYAHRRYSQSQLSQNVLDKSEGEMKALQENQSDYWNEEKRKGLQQQLEDMQSSHEHDYDQEDQQEQDSGKCDYCFMDMNGMDQRQHLLTQCKVLVSCEECMGRVYIRETIYHLLNECTNHTYHQQCKKCGLVFNIDEINEHVGQGICKLQRGEGWERCQFCGQDVIANDMKWVDHAYKCPNLPQPPELTQKQSQSAD